MVVQTPPEHDSGEAGIDVDAGVIEDARARHRRERLVGTIVAGIAVAAGLAFGLSGGGGGPGAASHHGDRGVPGGAGRGPARPLTAVTHPTNVTAFGLLAPGVGWAINDGDFYMTRDGGSRWDVLTRNAWTATGGASVTGLRLAGDLTTSMGPTSSPASRVLAISFDNSRIGAACAPPIARAVGVIAVTGDTGRTWATHVMPDCQPATSLSFLNTRLGYATIAPSTHDSELYRTVDGGVRWRLVSRFGAPTTVSFGSDDDGLALVTANNRSAAGAIYRTSDAGRSWQRLRICGPTATPGRAVYCGAPSSYGRQGVVLGITAATGEPRAGRALVYTTANAGRTWVSHRVPPLHSPLFPSFSAPNASDLFVYSFTGVLYRSTNGGRTWSSTAEPNFKKNLYQMQFISARYGWVIAGDQFDYTTDGGRRWRSLGTY